MYHLISVWPNIIDHEWYFEDVNSLPQYDHYLYDFGAAEKAAEKAAECWGSFKSLTRECRMEYIHHHC